MPLYFVDFNDGHTEMRDDVGSEASGPDVAREEAVRLLTEAAKDGVAWGNKQLLIATIRNGADQELYRIMLTLTCSQLGQETHDGRLV